MTLDPKSRRELIGIAALLGGTFLGIALLPWRFTGILGSGLGAALWKSLGIGALLFPVLGIALAMSAFDRFVRLSPHRTTILVVGLGLLIPYMVGMLARIAPSAFDPPFREWVFSARATGLVPGFLAYSTVQVVGVVGGLLVSVLALSALTLYTLAWHPLVVLRPGAVRLPKPKLGSRPKRKAAKTDREQLELSAAEPVRVEPPDPGAVVIGGPGADDDIDPGDTVGPMAYELPTLDLLEEGRDEGMADAEALLDALGETLVDTLRTFKVEGRITGRTTGPVVTQFEVAPGPGVKVGSIAALADDLALAMRAQSIRIVAPIPGKAAVGVEIPNPKARLVTVRELMETDEWSMSRTLLPIVLGRDLQGRAAIADLAKMPHLLIAGATGSGKSVCVNTIITSLVYRYAPEQLRFLMIDPKMVELSMYNVLPHKRHDVVTDNHQAAEGLRWAVHEMEKRYRLLHANKSRNLIDFNRKLADGKRLVVPSKDVPVEVREASDGPVLYDEGPLPYIIVIVEELADLMMTVQNEVEKPLAMLAQKARAIGIHLILATQRPSVNVITGLIKANFPSRIAFRVASKVDSRTIIDQNGAETLLGNGDMLFLPPGRSEPMRIQGCFIGTEETERLTGWFHQTYPGGFRPSVKETNILDEIAAIDAREKGAEQVGAAGAEGRDVLFQQAAEICVQQQLGSTSLLQRRLSIGYGRAARIIDQLEAAGVLGPANGSKPRDVLLSLDEIATE